MFIWKAISFWLQSQPSVEWSYTEFIRQVSGHNFTPVMISYSNTYHQSSDERRCLRFEVLETFSKG
jgi:hypothetical protein